MARTGVYPVFENKFKIGTKGRTSIDEDMKSLTAALESIGCKASEWEIDPGAERGSVTVVTKDNLEEDLSCIYGIDSDGHVAAIPDAESDGLFIGEGFKEDWLAKRAELQRKVDEINGRVDDINASGASGDERDALADELDRTLCWPLIDAYLAAAQECADRAPHRARPRPALSTKTPSGRRAGRRRGRRAAA